MIMEISEKLQRIAEDVVRQHNSLLQHNEDAAKQVSVIPFIEALGYNSRDLGEVQPRYSGKSEGEVSDCADFALMRDGNPTIIIFVIPADHESFDDAWFKLYEQFESSNAKCGILTNGVTYFFYTDIENPGEVDAKPFYSFGFLELNSRIAKDIECLSKTGFDESHILSLAIKESLLRLAKLEYDSPSTGFTEFLASQVYSESLDDTVINEMTESVRAAWIEFKKEDNTLLTRADHEPIREEENKGSLDIESNEKSDTDEELSTSSLAVSDLNPDFGDRYGLESGQFGKARVESAHGKDIPVFAEYYSERVQAWFVLDAWNPSNSKVRYRGQLYSPSTAANLAKIDINGVGSNTNGWIFWRFQDGYAARLIDAFRYNQEVLGRFS